MADYNKVDISYKPSYTDYKVVRSNEPYNYSKSKKYKKFVRTSSRALKKSERYAESRDRRTYIKAKREDSRTVLAETTSFVMVLGFILVILMLSVLLRTFTGGETMPTFASFIDMLVNIEIQPINFVQFSQWTWLSEPWTILDGLRILLRASFNIINILIFLFNGLISVVMYITQFMQWIFAM